MGNFMKRLLLTALSLLFVANMAQAKTDLNAPEKMLPKKIEVISKGEAFNYPLPEGAIIACHAKMIDGSIDALAEFNDYYVVRDGILYSNFMHRFFKKNRAWKLNEVDQQRILSDGETLRMYDPLWTPTYRHHMRVVKINTKTGEYYADVTQDNWTWYREAKTTGLCKVIYPSK